MHSGPPNSVQSYKISINGSKACTFWHIKAVIKAFVHKLAPYYQFGVFYSRKYLACTHHTLFAFFSHQILFNVWYGRRWRNVEPATHT